METDRLSVSQLQDRYNISRAIVYTRLDTARITPLKDGNHTYVTAEQLKVLDEMHNRVVQGRKLYEGSHSKGPAEDQRPQPSEPPVDTQHSESNRHPDQRTVEVMPALPATEGLLPTISATDGLALVVALYERLQAFAEPVRPVMVVPVADKLLLKLDEAQAITGLGREQLLQAIKAGRLQAKKIGGTWRIKRSDLITFVETL